MHAFVRLKHGSIFATFLSRRPAVLAALLISWLAAAAAPCAADVAFIAAPNEGGHATQSVSTRNGPYVNRPDAQLIIRDDAGNERVLVDSGALDFSMSLDGKSILASLIANGQSDIYRIDIATGKMEALTRGPGCNAQPVETRDGIAFISNRDGWKSPKAIYPLFTIYRMDRDGKNVERIWHAGLGGVFGLYAGPDGRLYFSSGENQGLKVGSAMNWVVWSINPDGSNFRPDTSGFGYKAYFTSPLDWPVMTSDGTLVWSVYYNTRIYGQLMAAPKFVATPDGPPSWFDHPLWPNNPPIPDGRDENGQAKIASYHGYTRRGQYTLAPWASEQDYEQYIERDGKMRPDGRQGGTEGDQFVGMLSHPYPVPGNSIYCTWTGDRGDANINLGVYKIASKVVSTPEGERNHLNAETPEDLIKVVDEPDRHEWMGKEVCSFRDLYDQDEPLASAGAVAEELPEGTPFGVIGTSAVDINEWPRYEGEEREHAKLVELPVDSAEYVRILSFNPTLADQITDPHHNGNPFNERLVNYEGLYSEVNERMGYYVPDIPLKKWRTPDGQLYLGPNPPPGSRRITRSDGRPDMSSKAQVPANQPWSIQLLNARREVIDGSTAQTWHQVIPRERRTDCQGCHAHWEPDRVPFDETFAATDEYPTHRLEQIRTIVYERDVAPLNLGIEQRPWDKMDASALHSFDDTLTRGKSWTPEQIELVAAWQGTGMMAAGMYQGRLIQPGELIGPYLDTMDPTLVVRALPDRTVIGAFDPDSGIDPSSLQIILDGKGLWREFTEDPREHTWTRPGALAKGVLKVTVADFHGNESQLEIDLATYEGTSQSHAADELTRLPAAALQHQVQASPRADEARTQVD